MTFRRKRAYMGAHNPFIRKSSNEPNASKPISSGLFLEKLLGCYCNIHNQRVDENTSPGGQTAASRCRRIMGASQNTRLRAAPALRAGLNANRTTCSPDAFGDGRVDARVIESKATQQRVERKRDHRQERQDHKAYGWHSIRRAEQALPAVGCFEKHTLCGGTDSPQPVCQGSCVHRLAGCVCCNNSLTTFPEKAC